MFLVRGTGASPNLPYLCIHGLSGWANGMMLLWKASKGPKYRGTVGVERTTYVLLGSSIIYTYLIPRHIRNIYQYVRNEHGFRTRDERTRPSLGYETLETLDYRQCKTRCSSQATLVPRYDVACTKYRYCLLCTQLSKYGFVL